MVTSNADERQNQPSITFSFGMHHWEEALFMFLSLSLVWDKKEGHFSTIKVSSKKSCNIVMFWGVPKGRTVGFSHRSMRQLQKGNDGKMWQHIPFLHGSAQEWIRSRRWDTGWSLDISDRRHSTGLLHSWRGKRWVLLSGLFCLVFRVFDMQRDCERRNMHWTRRILVEGLETSSSTALNKERFQRICCFHFATFEVGPCLDLYTFAMPMDAHGHQFCFNFCKVMIFNTNSR